ncbi:hypothetical protein Y032_0098g3119 [Ancylostoma ceylanicum]|nr:hypothetical protein Y032_0098g3119 [Ancylostoma ceylanicum]
MVAVYDTVAARSLSGVKFFVLVPVLRLSKGLIDCVNIDLAYHNIEGLFDMLITNITLILRSNPTFLG